MEVSSQSSSTSSSADYERILNLSTSNNEVMDIIRRTFDSGDTNPGEQQLIISALSQRSQLVQALSNGYRTLYDGMSAVIRNIRA